MRYLALISAAASLCVVGCTTSEECAAPVGSFCRTSQVDGLDLRATFSETADGLTLEIEDGHVIRSASCELEQVGCLLLGTCQSVVEPCEACGIEVVVLDGDSLYVDFQWAADGRALATVLARCGR